MSMDQTLWGGFLRSAEKFPEHSAVSVEGMTLTYRQLHELACRIAATIQLRSAHSTVPLTAVFAYRSPVAFAGVPNPTPEPASIALMAAGLGGVAFVAWRRKRK